MKTVLGFTLALVVGAGSLNAQGIPPTSQPLETRTIELRHLKPAEAVRLLQPYVRAGSGGVFDVSEKIPIITVRDTPENIAVMEKVLAKYDHTPATIRLVFQLIEADTGNRMTAASNTKALGVDLDSTLRSVLKFPIYRLLAQGVATTGEFAYVSQAMGNAGDGLTYELSANVGAIRLRDGGLSMFDRDKPSAAILDSATDGTVHIEVSLGRKGMQQMSQGGNIAGRPDVVYQGVISTGLDVPLGHMVVLGTAATRANGVALILTVKPELMRVGK